MSLEKEMKSLYYNFILGSIRNNQEIPPICRIRDTLKNPVNWKHPLFSITKDYKYVRKHGKCTARISR